MNDESNQLERRLEQATARRLPADTPLDSETAALREGWLALGQLLEAVETVSGPAAPLPAVPPGPPPRSWRVLSVVAALAASLLVAGVVAWKVFPTADSVQRANVVPAPAPSKEAPRLPANDLAKAETAKEMSWDGTLDEGITKAYQEFLRIEQDSDNFGRMSESVSTRLEELAQELETNTI